MAPGPPQSPGLPAPAAQVDLIHNSHLSRAGNPAAACLAGMGKAFGSIHSMRERDRRVCRELSIREDYLGTVLNQQEVSLTWLIRTLCARDPIVAFSLSQVNF